MMNPTQRRIAIYTRVSTAGQALDGVSLDAQAYRCQQWADLFDATVVEVVTDAGVSGKTLQRDGVSRLWELVKSGAIDTVVVTDQSRLSRSIRDYVNMVADFTERDVSLVCIDNGLDTSDTCGRLVAHIMAATAEAQREETSKRTRDALAQVKREGRHIGRPPVGLTSELGILRPAQGDRFELAQRAAAMNTAGTSMRAIAETFNAESIPTGSQRAGTQWHAGSVKRLIDAARRIAA